MSRTDRKRNRAPIAWPTPDTAPLPKTTEQKVAELTHTVVPPAPAPLAQPVPSPQRLRTQPTCPKCGSELLKFFIAGGMHQGRCKSCRHTFNRALAKMSSTRVEPVETSQGVVFRTISMTVFQPVSEPLDFEMEQGSFRDPRKNYDPRGEEE